MFAPKHLLLAAAAVASLSTAAIARASDVQDPRFFGRSPSTEEAVGGEGLIPLRSREDAPRKQAQQAEAKAQAHHHDARQCACGHAS